MNYSTHSRTELLALCKERGLSGAGTNEDLIERLQVQDDESAGQASGDDDPLADDEAEPAPPTQPAAKKAPVVAEEPAQAAAPVGETVADTTSAGPGKQAGNGPEAHVKEGVTGNIYRFEFYPDRPIDDAYHAHLIRETHHAARAAGHDTKGFPTVGHRVRFDADGAGKATVVYEVYLKRGNANGAVRR